ncbi:hypothetical protein BG57_15710 [Caballeronia grimmiae]|uniref:Uncharacterized protein n=1 Tax=Caballeronia grimmiae TaxID=1071679 RepID=A0A069NN41_9BURK|nr:hypothetical protein BG57_15710 [Caballeronia grimmiae]
MPNGERLTRCSPFRRTATIDARRNAGAARSAHAHDFGLALVVRFVTLVSLAPVLLVVDALLPAVFLRLDISVSAGWLA